MIRALYSAASGLEAQALTIDVIANNLANVNTTGFKKSRADFQDLLYQTLKEPGSPSTTNTTSSTGIQVGLGTRPAAVTRVHLQGDFDQTTNPLDVAIEGDGFFAVRTPRGERYTRAGSFQIGPDGMLVTAQGYAVLDQGGSPMSVQPDAKVMSFGADGVLTVDDSDVGQLKVVTFNQVNGLEKDGDTLFRATPRSGTAAPNPAAAVHAGALEMPNVSIVKGMTDLVSATRAFEALERAVEEFSQLEHRAATDIIGAR